MKTDFGNVCVGQKIFVEKIFETCDSFARHVERNKKGNLHIVRDFQPGEVCEIIKIQQSGCRSVWITYKSESGNIFTQLKRIHTKVNIID
jgi:hypothetical protein